MKKNIKDSIDRAVAWSKANRKEFLFLIVILAVAAVLRLYMISSYMTFLGDEGRDVIIVRRFLVDFDIMLIGPGTSIGNMYLGPLYYYLMAPPLLLANFSPVGPAVMIALLGIFTVWFVWFAVREWFPTKEKNDVHVGALIAAVLYSIAPTIIIYSRSSWNPNIMPFFALLAMYSLWRVWKYNQFGWMIGVGVAYAFILQSHYLGLILAPVIAFFLFLKLLAVRKEKTERTQLFRNSFLSSLLFLLLMSPLVIFDARHDWRNFQSMKVFFTERQTTVSARPWTAFPKIGELSVQINTSILGAGQEDVGSLMNAILIVALLYVVWQTVRNKKFRSNVLEYSFLVAWFGIALLGFGVYKQHIYDHYFGFLYPVPIMFLGGVMQLLWDKKVSIIRFGVVGFFAYLLAINMQENPLQYPPNRQYERSVAVGEKIIEESGGDNFNFAVIAERNYEGAYQYHLERVGAPFKIIDPQNTSDTITKQLFVICEMPEEECDPTHNDKAEVANFGWSKIESQWDVFGTTLYKLVHTEQ